MSATQTADPLSRTFRALADPTRRAILAQLAAASDDLTVTQLAAPHPVSMQAISKHLRVLERAGLITKGRTAQLRPSRLEGDALCEAADWLDQYRFVWEGRLDRLADHLRAITAGEPGSPAVRHPASPKTKRKADPSE